MFSVVAMVFSGLVQMLMVLAGATVIAIMVRGFGAEWQALFKKPLSGATARVFIYVMAVGFQAYNWFTHPAMPVWEAIVLAVVTVFCAAGVYHIVEKR